MNWEAYLEKIIKNWENQHKTRTGVNKWEIDFDAESEMNIKEKVDYQHKELVFNFPSVCFPDISYIDNPPEIKDDFSIRRCEIKVLQKIGIVQSRNVFHISECVFKSPIEFSFLTLENGGYLGTNIFEETVGFSDLEIERSLNLGNCVFAKDVQFNRCSFEGRLEMPGTVFNGKVTFRDCVFKNGINLRYSKPKQDGEYENVANISSITFDRCQFFKRSELQGRKLKSLLIKNSSAEASAVDFGNSTVDSFKITNYEGYDELFDCEFKTYEIELVSEFICENVKLGQNLFLPISKPTTIDLLKSNIYKGVRLYPKGDEGMLTRFVSKQNTFRDIVNFSGVKFTDKVEISDCIFEELLNMRNAVFVKEPVIKDSKFRKGIDLSVEKGGGEVDD